MLRLHSRQISSKWREAIQLFFSDVKELGHEITLNDNEIIVTSCIPAQRFGKAARAFWRPAHELRHMQELQKHLDWIRDFERRYEQLFITGAELSLDDVSPDFEIVDFTKDKHRDLVRYVSLYQTVTSRKLVGRRLGVLIFDQGQKNRPLIGAALLCSTRYCQSARDSFLNWPRVKRGQPCAVREAGLDRLLQLSVVCGIPPYSRLSAAWMIAALPFTDYVQSSYARAFPKLKDPDLCAVVTTSSMDVTGTPFQRHRVKQMLAAATPQCSHLLYQRLPCAPPLRASFADLLSSATLATIRTIHRNEQPHAAVHAQNAPEERLNRVALSYFLRTLGIHRSVFDGNEMGVHFGVIDVPTLEALRSGESRTCRSYLSREKLVREWKNHFASNPKIDSSTVEPDARSQIAAAGKRRLKAQETTIADILLSTRFDGFGNNL